MSGNKEGKYYSIHGVFPPEETTKWKIPVEDRGTGIDQVDRILSDVSALLLDDPGELRIELMKQAKVFSYIPKKDRCMCRRTDGRIPAIQCRSVKRVRSIL